MSGEKTEEPTEQKIRDARKKGQLPQRKNVLEAVLTGGGVLVIVGTWSVFVDGMFNLFDIVLSAPADGFDATLGAASQASFHSLSYGVIIACGLSMVLVFLNLFLTKFNFAPGSLTPKFEKLNPVNGIKGMFSKNTLYNFFRILVIFTGYGMVLYFTITGNIRDSVLSSVCGLNCIADVIPPLIIQTALILVGILLTLAVVDYKIQTAIFRDQNKMTKDEVKREFKGSQGDPMIKGKRNSIAKEDLVLPSRKDVTHVVYSNAIVVALLYRPGTIPFMVFKAKGQSAGQIVRQFKSMRIPCVNLPQVASSFHRMTAAGNYLHVSSAAGMADVLAAVEERRG